MKVIALDEEEEIIEDIFSLGVADAPRSCSVILFTAVLCLLSKSDHFLSIPVLAEDIVSDIDDCINCSWFHDLSTCLFLESESERMPMPS